MTKCDKLSHFLSRVRKPPRTSESCLSFPGTVPLAPANLLGYWAVQCSAPLSGVPSTCLELRAVLHAVHPAFLGELFMNLEVKPEASPSEASHTQHSAAELQAEFDIKITLLRVIPTLANGFDKVSGI